MAAKEMLVSTGPHRQSQTGYSYHVRLGFVMSCVMRKVARALFGTFSCLRTEVWGWELSGGTGETLVQ